MMPSWTKEQQEAINQEGTNIIVSAGAGSGKTAVLSERVLRKVKNGVDIDKLLILTFTKAAAYEMMIRIRENMKDAGMDSQLEKIEKAYITTFDSFALSIVKKYHFILNISKEVQIVDENLILFLKKEFLDQIFEEFYRKKDEKFHHLIHDFCIKDDQELKDSILKISDKLDMKYEKSEYLHSYLENFERTKIEKDILEYEDYLKREREKIFPELEKIRMEVDGDFYESIWKSLSPLFESQQYDSFKNSLDCKLPSLPRNSSDTIKKSKERIGKLLDSLREMCIYESKEEIIETILSTKDYVEVIIEIICALDEKICAYKHKNDTFEFVDISKLAIQLVKKHSEIRKELQNSFVEIMIDEYQDTNDLQEEFIRWIENGNVYMVGDIKQSIYRFRNANPYIFKKKYDDYSLGIGGYKIDLVKNFRSRKEVLEDINGIFNLIMDNHFGGADYSSSHQMVFGNTAYLHEGKTDQNQFLEIYHYEDFKDCSYTKEEIEAFLVANDIKEKIKNHYQVFDKEKKILRDATYQDFVILMDKSSKFELYKKIFEYEKLPLTILKDENIMNQIEIYLIHHLLELVLGAAKKKFDDTFRYAFLSVGRSYLFEMDDQELFMVLRDESYSDTQLYHHLELFFTKIATLDIENFLIQLINEFDFYTKLIRVGNVELSTNNLEYIIETASNLKKLGYTLEEFSLYLKNIIESGKEIKIPAMMGNENSVQMMTIHKSKGLEFPICYYTGLFSSFNMSDLKEKVLFDNTYGIITPYFKEGYGDTIYKSLLKNKFYQDEISEKIRLFYVALTRCKEKMIIVTSLKEEESNFQNGKVEENRRFAYRSFLDFLKSIYENLTNYIKKIDLAEVPMSLDYKKRTSKNLENMVPPSTDFISISEINIEQVLKEKEKLSKGIVGLLDQNQMKNLEFGKEVHQALEYLDFLHPNLEGMNSFLSKKIKAFLQLPIFSKCGEASIYKEYEFIDIMEGKEIHGVIDLMLIYPDHVDIIDYKLKTIYDQDYKRQLEGYCSYIKNLTGKKTDGYLYSILDEKLEKL